MRGVWHGRRLWRHVVSVLVSDYICKNEIQIWDMESPCLRGRVSLRLPADALDILQLKALVVSLRFLAPSRYVVRPKMTTRASVVE